MEEFEEEFIEESPGLIKYRRTGEIEGLGTATIEVYLSKAYLDGTQKQVIENYLNNAVTDIITRNREGIL